MRVCDSEHRIWKIAVVSLNMNTVLSPINLPTSQSISQGPDLTPNFHKPFKFLRLSKPQAKMQFTVVALSLLASALTVAATPTPDLERRALACPPSIVSLEGTTVSTIAQSRDAL